MARRDRPADDNGALRRYLLAEAEEFRRRVVDICLADQAMAEQVWRECSKAVDALAAGEDHLLCRADLPDDHPAQLDGSPNDLPVLDAAGRLHAVG